MLTEVVWKLLGSVLCSSWQVACVFFCWNRLRRGGGVEAFEVTHERSHALATPQKCSTQTKTFFFAAKTEFQSNNRQIPRYSVFHNRRCLYWPMQRFCPSIRDHGNHRGPTFIRPFQKPQAETCRSNKVARLKTSKTQIIWTDLPFPPTVQARRYAEIPHNPSRSQNTWSRNPRADGEVRRRGGSRVQIQSGRACFCVSVVLISPAPHRRRSAKPLTGILLFSHLKSKETLSPDLWPHNRNYWKDWVQHVTSIQTYLPKRLTKRCRPAVNTVHPLGFCIVSNVFENMKWNNWLKD